MLKMDELIEQQNKEIDRQTDALIRLKHVTEPMDFDLKRVSVSTDEVIMWMNDYQEMLKAFRQFRAQLFAKHVLAYQYSSGSCLFFHYRFENNDGTAIGYAINFECHMDKVPPELLGDCKIKVEVSTSTEYRMVCDN
jgi:hypothetical protein